MHTKTAWAARTLELLFLAMEKKQTRFYVPVSGRCYQITFALMFTAFSCFRKKRENIPKSGKYTKGKKIRTIYQGEKNQERLAFPVKEPSPQENQDINNKKNREKKENQ